METNSIEHLVKNIRKDLEDIPEFVALDRASIQDLLFVLRNKLIQSRDI